MDIENIDINRIHSDIDHKLIKEIKKEAESKESTGFQYFWDENRLYPLYLLWKKEGFSLRMIATYIKSHWGRSINK